MEVCSSGPGAVPKEQTMFGAHDTGTSKNSLAEGWVSPMTIPVYFKWQHCCYLKLHAREAESVILVMPE